MLLKILPVTQVSVERLFSALKIYKSDRRNQLKGDILSDMLHLRANRPPEDEEEKVKDDGQVRQTETRQ